MLYFISAFIIFILFLYMQRNRRISVLYLLAMCLLYLLAVISMLLYLSKDIRYYNIFQAYFRLPESVWKWLMFLPVSKAAALRLLNLFSLSTVFTGLYFSLLNQESANRAVFKKILWVSGIYLALEFVFYDPFIQKQLYLLLYPAVCTVREYHSFLSGVHTVTLLLNNALVMLSILNLFLGKNPAYSFPYFKYTAFGESLSYTLIMISWLLLFGQLPIPPIRYSRISGYTAYLSLPLYSNKLVYHIFPGYLLTATLIMGVSVVALSVLQHRVKNDSFSISSRIDASNTTSKAFCHYMKNELLSIQAQLQLLELPKAQQPELNSILARCQNLYNRLDVIHRSTKASTLKLEACDLEALIRNMLDRISSDLEGFSVSVQSVGSLPAVFVDANYFEQALLNLVTNALDAMRPLPESQRQLSFTLRCVDRWIALTVSDTGPGISSQNLAHIFEPFFSSRPIAEHWGIGLTVTHQIIRAHNGQISVESRQGKGTTFQILLPNLTDFE